MRPEDNRPYQKYGYFYVPNCDIQFPDEGAAWEYMEDEDSEFT